MDVRDICFAIIRYFLLMLLKFLVLILLAVE